MAMAPLGMLVDLSLLSSLPSQEKVVIGQLPICQTMPAILLKVPYSSLFFFFWPFLGPTSILGGGNGYKQIVSRHTIVVKYDAVIKPYILLMSFFAEMMCVFLKHRSIINI